MARTYDTSSLINCGSANVLDNLKAGGGMTISAWIYPTTGGDSNAGRIILKQSAAGNLGWRFNLSGASQNLQFVHTGGTALNVITSSTVSLNVWTHVLVTWDGSVTATNVHIYINGTEASYGTQTNGDTLSDDNAQPVTLGGESDAGSSFIGSEAEVAIWSGGAIAANEIQMLAVGRCSPVLVRSKSLILYCPLHGVGSPEPDYSGQANHGTVTGTVQANHPHVAPLMRRHAGWRGAFTSAVAAAVYSGRGVGRGLARGIYR